MRNVTYTNNGVVSSYTASNNTGSITNNSYFNNLYRGLSSPTAPNYCGMANRPIVPGECVDCDFNQIYQTAIDTNVDVESIEISRFLLYLTLDTDSILASMNDTLSGFYKANMPESVGKLADIEKTLGLGDFENAGSLMSNFEPQSNIENNFKTFYQLYYNYKTNENSLNEADMYALAILAAQCPFTDGFVVYKARLLNDVIINSITLYNDDECAGQGYSERTTIINNDTINQNKIEINFRDNLKSNEAKKINKINLKTEYTLYPNPTKDVIYIKGINQSEQIQIIIKDVWGRELVNKKIIVEASNTGLQFDLISGIYFVNLINEKGVINVKKLVIYK